MGSDLINTLFSLKDKAAIVTGAGGFFGLAFSECLLSSGAKVVMLGRGKKIKRSADEFKSRFGEKVDYGVVDFYDENAYKKCLDKIMDDHVIDILVNNAFDFSKDTGFNDPSGKLENISKKQWEKSLESGVYWHALAIQIVGEKMKMKKKGSIINVSSMYGIVSPDPSVYEGVEVFNPPSYGAAKAGLLALTRYVASFYGRYNIRCNALVPGAFPNVGREPYGGPTDDKFLRELAEKTVLGRVGKLNDLLGALIFLSSDSSSYMTGQNVVIDGGWTVR